MAGNQPFGRIIRFANTSGSVYYGEVPADSLDALKGLSVEVYGGGLPWDDDFRKTGEKETIHEVIARETVW